MKPLFKLVLNQVSISAVVLWLLTFLLIGSSSHAQDLDELPLFHMEYLIYEGAFRLPDDTYGASSLNYSEGPIEYNPDNHALFIVGHSHHQAIAEFGIPPLVKSEALGDLNMSNVVIQEFSTVLDRTPDGNPENINRIGGMRYFNGPENNVLIVNGYEYYDAPGDNTVSALIIRDCDDIANSDIDGYFAFGGGAGHTSGWISSIPLIWRDALCGDYITGQSSGIPIISRTSVGPSAFTFDSNELVTTVDPALSTTTLLDFSLQDPLHDDLSNNSLENDLWTHLSRATYGFIVPGSRTYFTLGYSGGHESGVCYKCTQDNGNLCGGYCAPEADDYYQYYWLWDMNDLLAVKAGNTEAHDVRPYEYGPFPTAFENDTKQIGGASFDPGSGILYLSIQKADRDQGEYSNPPVIVAYSFFISEGYELALYDDYILLQERSVENVLKIGGLIDAYTIQILDDSQNIYQILGPGPGPLEIDLNALPPSIFSIRVNHINYPLLSLLTVIKN